LNKKNVQVTSVPKKNDENKKSTKKESKVEEEAKEIEEKKLNGSAEKKRKVEEIVINDSNSPLSSQSSQSKKRRRNEDENLIIPSMIPSYSQSPIRKKLIVYSGCTIEEYDAMKEILKSLPNCELLEKGFELKNNSHVTHIVVGKNQKRTMNVMLGILMHKILVTVDWVHKCVEKKNWVDESDFLPEKYNKSTTHGPKLFSGLKFVLDQTEKKWCEGIETIDRSWWWHHSWLIKRKREI